MGGIFCENKALSYLIGPAVYIVIVVCLLLNLPDGSGNLFVIVIEMILGKIVADIIVFAIEKVRNKKKNNK